MDEDKVYALEDIQEPLKELLDNFEKIEAYETGVSHISGGFAHAEYDDMDDNIDGEVFFHLRWGVQSDCENTVHTENYRIDIADLINPEIKPLDRLKFIR